MGGPGTPAAARAHRRAGPPAVHSRRAIVNAILYADRTGCAWRYLPKDLPLWRTVYLCVPRSASTALTSRVARPAFRPLMITGHVVGAENLCHLGVCAEEAIGSMPARGGWWRVCTRAAVR